MNTNKHKEVQTKWENWTTSKSLLWITATATSRPQTQLPLPEWPPMKPSRSSPATFWNMAASITASEKVTRNLSQTRLWMRTITFWRSWRLPENWMYTASVKQMFIWLPVCHWPGFANSVKISEAICSATRKWTSVLMATIITFDLSDAVFSRRDTLPSSINWEISRERIFWQTLETAPWTFCISTIKRR